MSSIPRYGEVTDPLFVAANSRPEYKVSNMFLLHNEYSSLDHAHHMPCYLFRPLTLLSVMH